MRFLILPLALVSAAAPAQTAFTELALTDSDLTAGLRVSSAAPADVDGDGDLDLLVAGVQTGPGGNELDDRLTLYRNDGPAAGGRAFTAVPLDPAGLSFGHADLAWADVDGDGDLDVVVGADGGTVLYRNDPTGGAGSGLLVPTETPLPEYAEYDDDISTLDRTSLSWGDVDNDGDPDLLVPAVPDPSGFGYAPTVLLRNDGPGSGGAWTFTEVSAFEPAWNAVSRWGDADGDGDLDLLLGNVSSLGEGEGSFLSVYRNERGGEAGLFTPVAADLARLRYGMADWGDADGDGDLDVLVAGLLQSDENGEGGGDEVRVLYRTPGGYDAVTVVDDGPGSDWLNFNAASWADYDSDGDVDLLVAGEAFGDDGPGGRAQVFVNAGGTFTAGAVLPAAAVGLEDGAFVWFDVDGDGDLDYFTSGGFGDPFGGTVEVRSRLFRNDAASLNGRPTAPGALAAVSTPGGVALSWAASSDAETPAGALTYTLQVGLADGFAPNRAALPERGVVSGTTEWALRGLSAGTYAWSVRAVDTAFNGSPIATGTFVVGASAGESEPGQAGLALTAGPNPVRGMLRASLTLVEAGPVAVRVLDVLGREVAVLHDGAMAAGIHALTFDVAALPAGLYLVRAEGEGASAVARVTVTR